jgi:predicted amidophosphoribosyltransferase
MDTHEDNACIDCGRPVQFANERCEQCWREIDAEFEPDPLAVDDNN